MTTSPTGPVLPPLTTPSSLRPTETLSTWRVGQVLAATVVSTSQPGRAELRIGNLPVIAQTGSLALSPGQALRLEVASLKEQPVLKLLTLLQQDPVKQAVRMALPRQQPLPPLFAALARIAAGTQTGQPLAPDIIRAAQALLAQLPTAAGISQPAGLRRALRDSGLLLEAKLARSVAAPPSAARPGELARDFKANLLRLVQVIREHTASSAPTALRAPATVPTPAQAGLTASLGIQTPPAAAIDAAAQTLNRAAGDPGAPMLRGQPPLPPVSAATHLAKALGTLNSSELQRHVEAALARVQLNQLSSLPQERLAPEWLIELPVRRDDNTDVWSLRISRDDRQAPGPGPEIENGGAWSLMLAFDLPGIGPMQSRVTLRGDQVSAQFFSSRQGMLPLVSEHLPILQARLQQAGLRVTELTCHHGCMPAPAGAPRARILDERA